MWRFLVSATIALMIESAPVLAATPTQVSYTQSCRILSKCPEFRDHVIVALRSGNPVEFLRTIDGDTFWARVQISDGFYIDFKVRLGRIDAPEMRARCLQELELALAVC